MLRALLAITIAAICGGSVPVFAKVALEIIPPFNLIFLRFWVGSLFLLPFILKAKELNLNSFKLLGEKITIPFVIGALLALVGANLAYKRET
jgi:uncharacterized membrane protein